MTHPLSLQAETHYLGIGESLTLPSAGNTESLRIQKKGLLRIIDQGHELILSAKKLGETNVQLGSEKHQVKILHKKHFSTLKQLQQWQQGKRGPELEVASKEPVVKGRLLRIQDFLDMNTHMSEESEFRMAAALEPQLLENIRRFIDDMLVKNMLAKGQLSTQPYWQYKVGPSEKVNLSQYKKFLRPYGVQVSIDDKALTQKPVLQIKMIIAHVKKSFIRQWGIRWPSEFGAALIPGDQWNWQQLNLSLQALESQGQGQTLATPTLMTESGHTAEFHSGGEFPIKTSTQFNNNVQWKQYGLFLKTTPIANAQKNLRINIDLEFSALDQTQSNEGVPAITRSLVKTQINMKSPRPFLISGFLQQSYQNSRSGLPWLQNIPLLSPLFANGQIYRDDYELVFIMVPRFYDR